MVGVTDLAALSTTDLISLLVSASTELGRRLERADGPPVHGLPPVSTVGDDDSGPRRPRRVDRGGSTTRAVQQTRPGPSFRPEMHDPTKPRPDWA